VLNTPVGKEFPDLDARGDVVMKMRRSAPQHAGRPSEMNRINRRGDGHGAQAPVA